MPLTITDVTLNRVTLVNTAQGDAERRYARAAGNRMFADVAIITREHLADLISTARHAPGGMAYELEQIYEEFFG